MKTLRLEFILLLFVTSFGLNSNSVASESVALSNNDINAEISEDVVDSDNWQHVIRSIPYVYSKNFYNNLSSIRQWVLLSQGYCEQPARHILFNSQGSFLGYIDNLILNHLTQEKLNNTREELFKSGKVNRWLAGDKENIGYPFALNCDQPHADVNAAKRRLMGESKSDRLWGTWDGMSAGTEKDPIPLVELVEMVYQKKSTIINQPIAPIEFRYFLAQILIESGARKNQVSKEQAIGLLQLKASVLKDCQIDEKFYRHRMAQVDCAVRLFQQNRRNLQPAFEKVFGHLPAEKKDIIFSLLLVQSYHSGIGRMIRLLEDDEFNRATNYFAKHHQQFSAEDIASGMIYHNLGRNDLGFASLFYVIDVVLTAADLCKNTRLNKSWVCV